LFQFLHHGAIVPFGYSVKELSTEVPAAEQPDKPIQPSGNGEKGQQVETSIQPQEISKGLATKSSLRFTPKKALFFALFAQQKFSRGERNFYLPTTWKFLVSFREVKLDILQVTPKIIR
jgi:hypothetical protein